MHAFIINDFIYDAVYVHLNRLNQQYQTYEFNNPKPLLRNEALYKNAFQFLPASLLRKRL